MPSTKSEEYKVLVFTMEFMDQGDINMKKDNGHPIKLAKDLLKFWKLFEFPIFKTSNAHFGYHDYTSVQIDLFIHVPNNFPMPVKKQLSSFWEYVSQNRPKNWIMYGSSFELAQVSLVDSEF